MTRAFRFLALLLSAVLVLGACGDDDTATSDDSGGSSAGADGSDLLAGVSLVSDGSLTVCTDAPYEPFEFEGDDGEFTGFDMELLREIGSRLDLELAVTVQPFDGIWLGPAAGTCDIVASAMTITPERAEAATFSDPYFDADQSLLVRAEDEDTYSTIADLAGKRIAVQTGTTGETYANENKPEGATIQAYDEPAAMFLAIDSGEVDAILQDLPVNGYRATKDGGVVVTETFPTGEQYGFAAAKDNQALIAAVDDALAELRDDGTYDTIFTQWFGEV